MILFRVDGSRSLGLGHIVRCVSLADALLGELGDKHPIRFLVQDDAGARAALEVSRFAPDVHWLTGNEEEFGEILEGFSPRVVVTDVNLTGRVEEYLALLPPRTIHVSLHEHNYPLLAGDIVVAPTVRPLGYPPKAKPGVTHFQGPEYLLLPPDIGEFPRQTPSRGAEARRGLISLGGADPSRLTLQVLSALHKHGNPRIAWDVILGPASEYDDEQLAREFRQAFRFLDGSRMGRNEFLEHMAGADIVITNGATTLYEALALGRPALALPQNEFEAAVIKWLVDTGAVLNPPELEANGIPSVLGELLDGPKRSGEILEVAARLIDGRGCSRLAELIASRL